MGNLQRLKIDDNQKKFMSQPHPRRVLKLVFNRWTETFLNLDNFMADEI